jgi:hypothetical protein
VEPKFVFGHSPDLKHLKLEVRDIEACATTKVQNDMYAAFHKYLRKLKKLNQPEQQHDTDKWKT